ncbi:MAG: DoxX family protein [Nitrospirae bacterium]|nr:DoxX family protein [Nitrospirota bacterium]
MLKRILGTDDSYALLVLRIMLALVFFPHGAQKVFGWFGGNGFSPTLGFFVSKGIPAALAFLAIMAESVGVAALFAGLFTRVAALGIAVNMIICAAGNHVQNGFFMNWTGKQQGEGFEFHILAVAISLALIIGGGGRWSVDGLISGKRAPDSQR